VQSTSSELSWQSLCPSHLNFVWIPRPFLHLKYPTKYKIHLSLYVLFYWIKSRLISISTINSSNSVKNSPSTCHRQYQITIKYATVLYALGHCQQISWEANNCNINSTLYQNAVFWLVDERGIFFTNSSFFQLFHHCRDICLKISWYYRKISHSRRNPFFK
jgi:hypothetical protein